MSDLRWAARYAFSEELWRDRARIVIDAEVERLLRDPDRASEDAVEGLLDALVPRVGDVPVWMGVSDRLVARRLGAERPGTQFVAREDWPRVIAEEDWEALIVDATEWLGTDPDEAFARVSAQMDRLRVPPRAEGTIILAVPAASDEVVGLSEAEVAELARGLPAGGRVFGVCRPAMAAIVDFGFETRAPVSVLSDLQDASSRSDDETIEITLVRGDVGLTLPHATNDPDASDEDASSEDDSDDDEDDVAITFDNTLGLEEPWVREFVVVSSGEAEIDGLADTLHLVELPPSAAGETDDRVAPAPKRDLYLELEEALAREQTLKWRVGQLEGALAEAAARPVSELEAEVARLRRELELARGGRDDGSAGENGSGSGPGAPGLEGTGEVGSGEASPGSASASSSAATSTSASASSSAGPPVDDVGTEARDDGDPDERPGCGTRGRPTSSTRAPVHESESWPAGASASAAVIRVVDRWVRRIERAIDTDKPT